MESHDFREIYEIGGPFMNTEIINVLEHERVEHCERLILINSVKNHINVCAKYLLSLDDNTFSQMYIHLPTDHQGYENNEIYVNDEYSLIDYACAFISDEKLVRRCISISPVAINMSVKILTDYESPMDLNYIKLDLESCKLLHDNKCNIVNLLTIAYYISDYNTIRYLIESMSKMELIELLTSELINILNSMYGIILIDTIDRMNDKCLNKILYHKINSINILDNIYADVRDQKVILQCYYIIKYMTLDDGRKLFTSHIDSLFEWKSDETKKLTKEYKLLYNNLLEFHFRPRGSHTKAPRAF
jgi:hypothetical protein